MDRKVRIWIPHGSVAAGADRLPLKSASTPSDGPVVPVASPEVLIGLKVQPQRPVDVADLVALSRVAAIPAASRVLIDMLGPDLGHRLIALLLRRLDKGGDPSDFGARFHVRRPDAVRAVGAAHRFYGAMAAAIRPS